VAVTSRFLFLQGVCSPFFSRLGGVLMQRGHRVFKLNFTVGDTVYWKHRGAWNYRGGVGELAPFVQKKMVQEGITDVVLFGDKRGVHSTVTQVAAARNVRTHVFEEGYFRPSWVTLERGGVNGNSQLPRDPYFYRAVGPRMPRFGNGLNYPSPFWLRAVHDVAYHTAGALNKVLFPGYRTHAPCTASTEYLHYILRGQKLIRRKETDTAKLLTLLDQERRFFLFPLQLGSDAQIRHHCGFSSMKAVIAYVLESFAKHVAADTHLVVKNHPLDCGMDRYEECVELYVRKHGLQGRVHFLESGHLPSLLSYARGVVTVNSTVGGSALVHRTPLKALGDAIYDMAGLTFQGTLDEFWEADFRPDSKLVRLFRNTVIEATQINGGFYTREGIDAVVAGAIPRLEARRSAVEELIGEACR
jgi:capsular polysaccharide export protein